MNQLPARSTERRTPVSNLFAAALNGDQPAVEALRFLAEDSDRSLADPSEARRALRVLEGRPSNDSEFDDPDHRVASRAYADQLRARFREEQLPVPLDRSDGLPSRRGGAGEAWMARVSTWPTTGTRVVVWSERSPSRAPRGPHVSTVDHVAGLIFTVTGLDATFNRSTGRSKPVRRGAGAFGSETYIAVDAASDRAHDVLGESARRDRDAEASRAVHAWLADKSEANRRAAVAALEALEDG